MLSGTTVRGLTGNNSRWSMLNLMKSIFLLETFLKRSLKKPTMRNSPGQWRYPKPIENTLQCHTLDRPCRLHVRTRHQNHLVIEACLPSLTWKSFLLNGDLDQPDVIDLHFVVLFTHRSLLVAFRVKFIWVLPVKWVSAGFSVGRNDSAEARVPGAKRLFAIVSLYWYYWSV